MVRIGERFYTSLGFAPLPKTFWERSLFVRPRDREVVCHASAWDIDYEADVRIKMCIEQTAEDFSTIHHELGHNFYQRAYKDLPVIFRDSANDGFHEAIGDTIALSVTPEYLVRIGLLDKAPDASRDIGLLMSRALEKVAFLPFGLLIDQWRWKVFSGEVKPEDYNKAWWDLRLKYQGIAPPSPRGEEFFDPGAKYHVPDNTPYARYFLADILQFQFHRALVEDGRLHDAAAPLLDLREQGSGPAAERDAGDGHVEAVARRARGDCRLEDRWTRRRSSITSRRSRRGSTNSSKVNRSAGSSVAQTGHDGQVAGIGALGDSVQGIVSGAEPLFAIGTARARLSTPSRAFAASSLERRQSFAIWRCSRAVDHSARISPVGR